MTPVTHRLTGAPCWIDVFTSDPDRTAAFYGDLLGWRCEVMGEEYGGYLMFHQGDQPVAGGMRNDGSQGTPDMWSVYLRSEDAAATTAAAAAHGGTVVVEPMEVPGTGVMAMVVDPGGSAIGVWQAKPFEGTAVLADPGTPAWFELHTRAYDEVLPFYREVFGWDTHVTMNEPQFRYTTLGGGDEQAAGVMDGSILPEDAPMEWGVYFAVEDSATSVQRAVDLGATLLAGPDDTPYGLLASLRDPVGARFKLIQLPG